MRSRVQRAETHSGASLPRHSDPRLSRSTRIWINSVGLGLWGSGAGWLVSHYLLRRPDPFGPDAHVLEPWWLKAHGAMAFLALWTGGLLWGVHMVKAWQGGRGRWTGGTLFAALLALSLSGYLLYYVAEPGIRDILSLTHWIIGLLLPVCYLAHRLSRRVDADR